MKFCILAFVVFFSLPSIAATYSIRYDESETRGYTAIQLKQDLFRVYPYLRGQDLQLQNITVVAKSYNGMGTAQLRVGRWASGPRSVDGRAIGWNDPAPDTYDRVAFYNYGYESRGPWQVILNGQIRVRELVVQVLEQPRSGGNYTEVICQSLGAQPRLCQVPFQVRQVTLLQQYAGGPCVANVTFFASPIGVEVRNGCRGRFAVYGFGY